MQDIGREAHYLHDRGTSEGYQPNPSLPHIILRVENFCLVIYTWTHLSQYINGITAKRQIRRSKQTQGIKLMSEGSFGNGELGSIGTI